MNGAASIAEVSVERLDIAIDGHESNLLCAFRDGVFIGFVRLLRDGATAEMQLLFVRPVERRNGVARKLVEHCAWIAKSTGAPALSAVMQKGNEVAAQFYAALGFIVAYEFDDASQLLVKTL
jgi:GNAT superfamily N-acetyltransferase